MLSVDSDPVDSLRRCSLFLTPEECDRPYLEDMVREVSAKFDLLPFEPHVTIYSGLYPDFILFRSYLTGLLAGIPPIRLKVRGIGSTPEYFKSIFIEFEEHPVLRCIHERIGSSCWVSNSYDLAPHLSLLYAELPLDAKETVISSIHIERGDFLFDEVKLVTPLNMAAGWRDTRGWHTICRVKLCGK